MQLLFELLRCYAALLGPEFIRKRALVQGVLLDGFQGAVHDKLLDFVAGDSFTLSDSPNEAIDDLTVLVRVQESVELIALASLLYDDLGYPASRDPHALLVLERIVLDLDVLVVILIDFRVNITQNFVLDLNVEVVPLLGG